MFHVYKFPFFFTRSIVQLCFIALIWNILSAPDNKTYRNMHTSITASLWEFRGTDYSAIRAHGVFSNTNNLAIPFLL